MTTMFRTGWGNSENPIQEFEIIKKSSSSVWFIADVRNFYTCKLEPKDQRQLLKTNEYQWHDTRDEAKDLLIKEAREKLARLDSQAKSARDDLIELVEALK